jgi:hypothetical protein
MNHNVKIKNYLFKRKEVDISKSNTSLDFNDKTSNLKLCPLKSLRVATKEHLSKIIVVGPKGCK